ncbi:MAG: pgl 1, partial [Armatimonadetes bacterium]|nr:pgl 1 [Armatimonadota bacterium]
MLPTSGSRRSFLKAAAGVAGAAALTDGLPATEAGAREAGAAEGTLMAYVGTFSSPLQDVLPTQVDLPPGNGRGIHLFEV